MVSYGFTSHSSACASLVFKAGKSGKEAQLLYDGLRLARFISLAPTVSMVCRCDVCRWSKPQRPAALPLVDAPAPPPPPPEAWCAVPEAARPPRCAYAPPALILNKPKASAPPNRPSGASKALLAFFTTSLMLVTLLLAVLLAPGVARVAPGSQAETQGGYDAASSSHARACATTSATASEVPPAPPPAGGCAGEAAAQLHEPAAAWRTSGASERHFSWTDEELWRSL